MSVVPLAVWGSAWAWLGIGMGAQLPDASVPDGDPCCGHPDTWFETILLTGAGLIWALVCAAVLALSVATFWWAIKGRPPTRRRVATLGAAIVVLQPIVFALLVLTHA